MRIGSVKHMFESVVGAGGGAAGRPVDRAGGRDRERGRGRPDRPAAAAGAGRPDGGARAAGGPPEFGPPPIRTRRPPTPGCTGTGRCAGSPTADGAWTLIATGTPQAGAVINTARARSSTPLSAKPAATAAGSRTTYAFDALLTLAEAPPARPGRQPRPPPARQRTWILTPAQPTPPATHPHAGPPRAAAGRSAVPGVAAGRPRGAAPRAVAGDELWEITGVGRSRCRSPATCSATRC